MACCRRERASKPLREMTSGGSLLACRWSRTPLIVLSYHIRVYVLSWRVKQCKLFYMLTQCHVCLMICATVCVVNVDGNALSVVLKVLLMTILCLMFVGFLLVAIPTLRWRFVDRLIYMHVYHTYIVHYIVYIPISICIYIYIIS